MKLARRATALALSLVLVLSLVMAGYAVDSQEASVPTLSLKTENDVVEAGKSTTFIISLTNNPGVSGMDVSYQITDSYGRNVTAYFSPLGAKWLNFRGILTQTTAGSDGSEPSTQTIGKLNAQVNGVTWNAKKM